MDPLRVFDCCNFIPTLKIQDCFWFEVSFLPKSYWELLKDKTALLLKIKFETTIWSLKEIIASPVQSWVRLIYLWGFVVIDINPPSSQKREKIAIDYRKGFSSFIYPKAIFSLYAMAEIVRWTDAAIRIVSVVSKALIFFRLIFFLKIPPKEFKKSAKNSSS